MQQETGSNNDIEVHTCETVFSPMGISSDLMATFDTILELSQSSTILQGYKIESNKKYIVKLCNIRMLSVPYYHN